MIKKLLNKISITLLVLILPIVGFSQAVISKTQSDTPMDANLIIGGLRVDNFRASDLQYDDIDGSPYLEDQILQGYLILNDGQKTEEVILQFDIYTNEFFHVDEKGREQIIDIDLCKEIIMQGKEERYLFKNLDAENPNQLFDILYEDEEIKIYSELKVRFYEGKNQGVVVTKPRFNRYDNYYVMVTGGSPKKVKLKKKNILKLFRPDDQEKLKSYLNENKLKLKESKDFKILFQALKN